MDNFTTISKSQIGRGIYTISDVSRILDLPSGKVRRWIQEYWDAKYGVNGDNLQYSWDNGLGKVVDFYTLIEVYVFSELRNAGVKIKDINKAHFELSERFNTPFPFSNREVINKLKTDGNTVYFGNKGEDYISLDGTGQLNLGLIHEFFKKVEFDGDLIVSRFYPLGKRKSIVIDPNIKLGQPVVENTGIDVESIYDMYKSGEKIKMIAYLYDIDSKSVRHAIKYCKLAA